MYVGRYLIAKVGKTHNILENKLPVSGTGSSGRCRLVVGYWRFGMTYWTNLLEKCTCSKFFFGQIDSLRWNRWLPQPPNYAAQYIRKTKATTWSRRTLDISRCVWKYGCINYRNITFKRTTKVTGKTRCLHYTDTETNVDLEFKLLPCYECCILYFGRFSGVLIFCADI
jgi:hypothetical protein